MYVATRGLYKMKPPTIFVPPSIKENVERLFEAHRAMDQSELKHNLVALNVGEASFQLSPFSGFSLVPPVRHSHFPIPHSHHHLHLSS